MTQARTTTSLDADAVHYWTYGDKQNPPIVFIHGFTGSHEGFQYLVPLLEDTFHLLLPDIPGFGTSAIAEESWSIEGQARAINAWVASLKLQHPPYLVSHSMGGLVANEMLRLQPQLYQKKTVFISPPATASQWRDGRKLGALANELLYTVGSYAPIVGPAIVKSKSLSRLATALMLRTRDRSQRHAIYQHHIDNLQYISSIELYRQLFHDISRRGILDSPEHLGNFSVHIISGDTDNVTPIAGQRILAHQINATLTILHATGHLAHYEQPEKIAASLKHFLP